MKKLIIISRTYAQKITNTIKELGVKYNLNMKAHIVQKNIVSYINTLKKLGLNDKQITNKIIKEMKEHYKEQYGNQERIQNSGMIIYNK